MKCLVDDDVVLARAPEGPLAACIGMFAKSRRAQGYVRGSIHRQVLLAASFSQWLKRQGVALGQICSEHPLSRGGVSDPAGAPKLIHPGAGKVIHP